MHRVSYRNFGDHEAILVNHSADLQGTTAIRWYELRLAPSGDATLFQQGTFAPDANHRWIASSAMDALGDIAIGYSVASSSLFPSIRYSGRLAADPPGILTMTEGSLQEGAFAQTSSGRWGDYASMQVDPIDDCTFWLTSQYAERNSRATRIGAFRFPGCGSLDRFALELSPNEIVISPGQRVSATIVSRITEGSPGPIELRVDGLPKGVTAIIDGGRVNGAASVDLSLTADSAAPLTAKTFSVEGTSGTTQSGVLALIRVAAAPSPPAGCDSGEPSDHGLAALVLVGLVLQIRRRQRRPPIGEALV